MTAIKNNSLARFSDSQIIKRLDALVQKERETTLEGLSHIIEMERRKLYLARGYASLYEYCTRHLGYSESAASRRIKTARCIRDFPEIYDLLAKNEVSLSIVSKLSIILNEKNKNELLEEVRFQSARQVDAIIARHRPMSILRERARPVYVKSSLSISVTKNDSAENSSSSPNKSDKKFTADVGGKKLGTFERMQKQDSTLVQKFKLGFAVNPDVMKKLEEAKALLSKKYPRGVSFEQVFEVMLDEYLERHSPKRKMRRREKRKAKQIAQQDNLSTNEKAKKAKANIIRTKRHDPCNHRRSRHIPQAVQDKVFARDRGRCTFVGRNGVRCNSAWNVQIDHIEPFARGGTHSLHNLRLLCAKHNNLEAQRIYGRGFMKQRMNEQTPKRE